MSRSHFDPDDYLFGVDGARLAAALTRFYVVAVIRPLRTLTRWPAHRETGDSE